MRRKPAKRVVVTMWLIATFAALPSLATATLSASFSSVVRSGVESDWGESTKFVAHIPEGSREAFAQDPAATGVHVAQGHASGTTGSAPAQFRTLTGTRARTGTIAAGRRAVRPDETTLSIALSRKLHLGIGDRVAWSDPRRSAKVRLRVVGITRNPAALKELTLVSQAATSNTIAAPDYWLLTKKPSSAELAGAQLTSVPSETTEREATGLPRWLEAARWAAWPITAILLVPALLVAVILTHRSQSVEDPRERGTGPGERPGGLLLAASLGGLLTAATLAGALNLSVAQYVSVRGEQAWPWSGPPVSLLLVATLLIVIAAGAVWKFTPAAVRIFERACRRSVSPAHASLGLALGVGCALLAANTPPWVSPPGVLMLAGTAACASAASTMNVYRITRPSGRARAGTSVILTLILSLAMLGTFSAAWTMHDVRSFAATESPTQPRGTFLIFGASESAAHALVNAYREDGGFASRWDLPDESEYAWRASSSELVQCLLEDPTSPSCWQAHSSAPLESVAVDTLANSTMAAPWAREADGTVSVALLGQERPVVARHERLSADVSSDLGGNLPGLVLPSDVARRLGWDPDEANLTEVAMDKFEAATESTTHRVRELVADLAPAAQVSDGEDMSRFVAAGETRALWIAILTSIVAGGAMVLASRLGRGSVGEAVPVLVGATTGVGVVCLVLRGLSDDSIRADAACAVPLVTVVAISAWFRWRTTRAPERSSAT